MRSEFKEEEPLSAVDLVFGLTGPREADNIEGSKNREVAKGNPHGMAHAQSLRLAAHKEDIGGDVNERMVEWAGVDARKSRALKTLPSSRPTQEHDVGGPSSGFAASQQQQTSFRLPSLHLENETLGLQFQKPATDIHEEGEVSNSQRIYEVKRSRREQRRSLVESGDFLGVQGANPRTGYWDISTGTTSSDPSQLSSKTRKKLQHQAKEVEEHWQNYAEAQEKYIAGLEMVQTLKRKKEAEKMEQKRRQLGLRQRRRGRWNAGENGWSSVAEPDLSPVVQSVAGSPVKERAPGVQSFSMPSARNPAPYLNDNIAKQQDYFRTRTAFLTQIRDHNAALLEGSARPPVRTNSIPRKSLPPRRRQTDSSDTVLHHGKDLEPAPNKIVLPPTSPLPSNVKSHLGSEGADTAMDINCSEKAIPTSAASSQQTQPFLGKAILPTEPGGSRLGEVIVISYRLASMSQALILPRFLQSLEFLLGVRSGNPSKPPPIFLRTLIVSMTWSTKLRPGVFPIC